MPTDVDRYTPLLQNLAVGIGAIREAIERALGVTLPTAATLNAELSAQSAQPQTSHDRFRTLRQGARCVEDSQRSTSARTVATSDPRVSGVPGRRVQCDH
jgi:hypothetical protein